MKLKLGYQAVPPSLFLKKSKTLSEMQAAEVQLMPMTLKPLMQSQKQAAE